MDPVSLSYGVLSSAGRLGIAIGKPILSLAVSSLSALASKGFGLVDNGVASLIHKRKKYV